ncbi:MAG: DMT family transporter [Chitinophagaceae bacterium]|nr:DMT family transporter [Chitinophagaceae bacterium]
MKKAFLQLHAAIFLAGFTGILGRLITLNEGLLVWYRMLFSALGLFVLLKVSGKEIRFPEKGKLALLGVGGIVALHWTFFYGSIKYANVSIALVCFSAVGFFTALIDPLLTKRRVQPVELFLGLMVMLGIYLIFHFDEQYQAGIVWGVISSLLAALFTILNKKLIQQHGTDTVTLFEMGGGWLVLTLLLPIYLYRFPTDHIVPSWSDFFWLLFLSLLCTVLAFRLSLDALRKISPFTVNLSYNLEPVYGIILAFIVYQENKYLGWGFYTGFAIILGTVLLQSWRVWRKHA